MLSSGKANGQMGVGLAAKGHSVAMVQDIDIQRRNGRSTLAWTCKPGR